MPRIKARRFLWEVGTSYNVRRLLWGVIRFVFAVTGMRANQPGGLNPLSSALAALTCGVRRFLWKAVRPIMSKRSYGK